jgi:hypothetical protein
VAVVLGELPQAQQPVQGGQSFGGEN